MTSTRTYPPMRKVTAFITRDRAGLRELLLFYRPADDMTQIPAGTIDAGETPYQAVVREAAEESGLTALRLVADLGSAFYPVDYALDPLERFFYHFVPIDDPGDSWLHHDPADGNTALHMHWRTLLDLIAAESPLPPMQRQWLIDYLDRLERPIP